MRSLLQRGLPLFCGLALFLLPLTMVSSASAHKVNLFAYVEGGTVYTESYFPDGRPVTGGTVTVTDQAGNQLVEGQTDAEGKYSFPIPAMTDLQIRLQASMGHQIGFSLPRQEVEAGR